MACFNHSDVPFNISSQSPHHSDQSTDPVNSRSRSPRQNLPNEALHGELAFLNRDMVGSDSIIFASSIINEGAFNHPVAIVGSINDGTIATCVQLTSFGNDTITTKYPRANLAPRRMLYLAIDHHHQTQAHDGTRVLQLQHGRSMDKQTYVHLDGFFQIETKYLTAWKGRRNHLTTGSLAAVQVGLMLFMTGQMEVPRGLGIVSCLDNGLLSPLYFGLTAAPILRTPVYYPQPLFVLPMAGPSAAVSPWTIDDGLAAAWTRFNAPLAVSPPV